MKIVIKDGFNAQTYTISKMYINGTYFCDILEDKMREKNNDGSTIAFSERKIKGKTAIPAGVYFLELTMSSRFNKVLPILRGIPWFSGVRFHSGNTEFDTDGCLIVGKNTIKGKVMFSRVTMFAFMRLLRNAFSKFEPVTVEIIRT